MRVRGLLNKTKLMGAAALIGLSFVSTAITTTAVEANKGSKNILIFSKTAAFRHYNIEIATDNIKLMADRARWTYVHTEESDIFTPEDLAEFDAVVFVNTSGDILDEEQENAFREYIENGGGFAGIHAASDTEKNWDWYINDLVGAKFISHPKGGQHPLQVFKSKKVKHPSVNKLPTRWVVKDELYVFGVGRNALSSNFSKGVTILQRVDTSKVDFGDREDLRDRINGRFQPVTWCKSPGENGGRSWYTGLGNGHQFNDREFRAFIWRGIKWAAGNGPMGACGLK